MHTVTVVAIRDFTYQGRRYRRGDNVTMTAVEAAVAAQAHDVSLAERPRPEPLEEPVYQRRDLVPEFLVSSTDTPTATPKRRSRSRRSRRKDLVAEP